MNTLISEIWPALTIIVPIVVLYFGYIQQLRIRVAVLEESSKNQQQSISELQKRLDGTTEALQKRLDSHSKKQDEFVDLINDLKLEMVKQISGMSSELNTIATDVRSINRMFRADDEGITIKHTPRNNKKD